MPGGEGYNREKRLILEINKGEENKHTEYYGVEGYNRGKLGIVRGIRRRKETQGVSRSLERL